MIVFDSAGLSRTGPRADNQDTALGGPYLVAVADGVGGNVGGAIASSLVAGWLAPFACGTGGLHGPGHLGEVVRLANTRITAATAVRPGLEGMATTLVLLHADADGVVLAWIGDSRAYLLRDGVLSQLSVDQTLVQALVDAGRLRPEDIRTHPQRSVVYAAMHGGGDDVDAMVVQPVDVRAGDRLMVCSDGLSDVVPAGTIATVLVGGSPAQAAAALVQAALDGPASDNVTVVVADAHEAPEGEVPATVCTYGAGANRRAETAESMESLWP